MGPRVKIESVALMVKVIRFERGVGVWDNQGRRGKLSVRIKN